MISVIIGLKNRFEHFRWCLKSLILLDDAEMELIVVDFNSDDGNVAAETKAAAREMGCRASILTAQGPFNWSHARNIGVAAAKGRVLLFLDADMVVPRGFLHRIEKVVKPGTVYFPECWREDEKGNIISDHHCSCGYGLCALMRQDIEKVGGWDESFVGWGYEDVDFKNRCEKAGLELARESVGGFIHLWHPNTWKHRNRHSAVPEATRYVWRGEGNGPWTVA